MMLSFFFSSRRRHTRWPRDWSSDVCSSDLNIGIFNEAYTTHKRVKQIANHKYRVSSTNILNEYAEDNGSVRHEMAVELRSEERRVGKECRSRCGRPPEKEKSTVQAHTSRRQ